MNKQRERVHASNSRANGPKLTSYLWLAALLWFTLLICGFAWIFLGSDNGARRKEVQNKIESKPSFRKVLANPSIVDSNVAVISQTNPIPITIDSGNKIDIQSINNGIVTHSLKVPLIDSNPLKIDTNALKGSLIDSNLIKVDKNVIPVLQKKKKYTFKDIWAMSAIDQRAALQSMHTLTPPSDKLANDFIAEAKLAVLNGVQPGELPIWPNPGDGAGAPGDMVQYQIASKHVTVPYGYPEETIFVLTASYKDPEVASTIARLYARAAHPDRIFVGIHAQNDGGEESPERDPIAGLRHAGVRCPQHPVCSHLDNIHVSRQHFMLSEGPTVARARAERFYNNETYVLGIDSHCHFVRGWDNVAIDMFKRIHNEYAIITTYPDGYDEGRQGGDGSEDYDPAPIPEKTTTICQTRRVNLHTTVSFKHNFNIVSTPRNGPTRVAFFAAGFSFSRGHRILRVPYDFYTPYVFDGEETSMGVRAWTWGYDLYQPDRSVISHLYISSGSSARPVFWDAPDWGVQWPCQYSSVLRLQKQLHIFDKLQQAPKDGVDPGGRAKEGKLDLTDFEKYEVGPRRDVEDFWKWAKIDIQNNWGPQCNESPWAKKGRPGPPKTGRQFCYSEPLCDLYVQEGGMPYVPWKAGTENL